MSTAPNETVVGSGAFKLEDGILFVSFVPGALHDLNNATLVIAKQHELLGNAKVPTLVDGTNLKSVTPEARAFHASPEGSGNTKALAMIANTTAAKVVGNLYLGLNGPPYPARMFTNKEEALAWLQQYK